VTHNGLNGLGSNRSWGRNFVHPSILALGPTQPLVQWVLGPVLWGEATRAVLTTPPLRSADIKTINLQATTMVASPSNARNANDNTDDSSFGNVSSLSSYLAAQCLNTE